MILDNDITYNSPLSTNQNGKFGASLSGGTGYTPVLQYGIDTFSICFWCKMQNTSSIKVAISTTRATWIGVNSNGTAAFSVNSGAIVNTSAQIADGNWHYIALVVNTTGSKLFVDGNIAGSNSSTSNYNLTLYFRNLNGQYLWSGEIDEVAVYNIEKYTASFTPPTTATPSDDAGLIALFNFDFKTDGFIDNDIIYNSPIFNTSGKFGASLSGGTGYTPVLSRLSNIFTLSCWIKLNNYGPIMVAVGSVETAWIGVNSNGTAAFSVDSGAIVNTSAQIADGNWHHIALVVNTTGSKLFVDGNIAGSDSSTLTGRIIFGLRYFYGATSSYLWSGEIDEVAVYNIEKYTASFTPPTTATPSDDAGLIALFNLNGYTPIPSEGVNIFPNDLNIIYSPYNWKVDSISAKTINPGAYFRCTFEGASCKLHFELDSISEPIPTIWYRVDNYGNWINIPVASIVVIAIPIDTSSWNYHILEVVVKSTSIANDRWTTQNASVKFLGLELVENKTLLPIVKLNDNVLFYCDSIGEGIRTNSLNNGDNLLSDDSKQSFAYELGRLLGCEFGIVGFGAQGWNHGGSGNVPSLPNAYNYLWSGQLRDFSQAPKLVIINMGHNDSDSTISNIITFLNGIISSTPPSTKIILLRPFSGNQASNIQTGIAGCNTPSRCIYFDTTGFFDSANSSDGVHPFGFENVTKIAPKLLNKLRELQISRLWFIIN